jgi:hypothetical protein
MQVNKLCFVVAAGFFGGVSSSGDQTRASYMVGKSSTTEWVLTRVLGTILLQGLTSACPQWCVKNGMVVIERLRIKRKITFLEEKFPIKIMKHLYNFMTITLVPYC